MTDMTAMFNNVAVFNQDLSNWNVSAVTSMAEMFSGASAFNQNLGTWDVGNVGSMSNMLRGVTLSRENYDSLLVGWSTIETGETPLQQDITITFHPGNSQYCNQEARDILTETNGWMIPMNTDSRATNCPSPPPPPEAFVTTWTVSANQTITIPINTNTGAHNYTVDWGDGTVPENYMNTNAMHTYTDVGTYTIAITATPFFRHIHFNDSCSAAIRTIEQWGDIAWLSMEDSFYGCNNLTIAANAGAPDLSRVTSMWRMFQGAASLNSPVNHWDVSSVTDMRNMFHDASVFNQDLSDWDVSSVTTMNSMFNGATAFNQNLGAWDVSSANMMINMFSNITSLSRENYDSLLDGWSTIEMEKGEMMLQTTVSFGAGTIKFCNESAHNALTNPPNNWDIDDGGKDTDDNCTLRFAADTGIANQTYAVGTTIAMVLPSAIGGVAPLSYKLEPLPPGLMLLAPTADTGALLTGVPNAVWPATPVIYTATATDGETSALTFMIKVLQTAPPPPLATLSLGTVSGVDLNLRFPVTTIDGKTYYYLDVDNSGEGDSPDLLNHVVLDNLLNNGADTTHTLEGPHNGNDDARSVIVGTHTLILPTLAELQTLRADQNNSPPSWGTGSHYRSATRISANSHQLFNLGTEEIQAADDDDNTMLSFVSFQVLRTPDEYLFAPAPAPAPDSVAFFAASERVPSDWPWIPPGVSLNQAFRLLITTWDNSNKDLVPPISGTIDATSADIETYNAYVQDIAAQSNTGITDFSDKFRALISTPDVDARDNTFTNRVTDTHPDARIHWLWAIGFNRPINSNRIANNYEDFYNGWNNVASNPGTYVGKNGFIAFLGGNQIGFPSTPWTGSNLDGTGDEGFEAGNPVVRYGNNSPGGQQQALHFALAFSSVPRVLLAMSPRIITGPSILRLGTVNGIDLTLLGPVTLNGKTYYYWDRSGDGLSDNADAVSHNDLDTLLNNGDDTFDTQSDGHIGDDDARSVIIANNLASYTLVLPNTTELNGLFSSHSPPGWSDIAYWSATRGPNTETHETIAYGNGTDDGSVSDTSRRWVAFQLLALAPAAPVIQTVTDESALIPDADGDGPIVGESFRLLFISSNTINANSDNIAVYNRFAQEVAARFPYINFSEQFRALISTPDVDARDNTNTIGDGVPIYWLNGEKVADDYPDFYDGDWDSQDGKAEIRTTPRDTFVMWTGSNSAGTGAQAVGSAAATANTGRLQAGQEISFAPENKGAQRHLYIMSPIIRVASAQSMIVPVDWALIPDTDSNGPDFTTGQSFRLLFITSDTRNAASADIGTYNLAVQDTASNATGSGMPIADFSHQFRALISTPEVDARDNTATTGNGVPIYWLNGDKVADDYDNFYDGEWDSQIGKNEHGIDIADTTLVWTGSNSAGIGAQAVGSAAATANTGRLQTGQEISFEPKDKGAQHNLYALSPVIIVHNIPTAPTSVMVTSANELLNVSWNIPDNVGDSLISSYMATASAAGQPSRSCITDGLFEVACTITDLTNNIEYSVIVIATNDGGNSEPSLPVMGTPTDLGICTRTQAVREAIIATTTSTPCEDINNNQLVAISRLDLSNKSIRSLQANDFDGLTGLTSLDLSSNTLLNLPADIFTDLEHLTELRMNNNLLFSLPTGIFDNLTNLTDLNLASNFLSSLSADIFSDLDALETLRLTDNDLFSLPSGIFSNLVYLQELYLNDNRLSSLPNGIFNNLAMLINLDLSLNGLTSLSIDTFSDLAGLNALHLNGNSLSTLDENIFNSLTTLSLLNLSNNFLSTLHKNIFSNLDSLMELQLSFNDLSALPKEIFANLANLQSLSLSINRIDELIPGTFDNLTNLNALYLDNNDLSILPPAIFSGLPLEALFLSYNHLNELPSDIFHNIRNLRALGVDSNDGDPGSPFELLLTLVRIDQENHSGPATVSLQITEGAPFTMTVPIMISNGNVNNLNLTINAGDTESDSIMLSQNKISENTVMTISQIPSIPEDFSGIRLVADDALRLFPVIPVAPTNVIVTPGNQQLRVSWAAPSNDSNNPITGYTVTAVGAGQTHRCTADAQMNFCVITGLRNGIEYTVQVVTSNDNGNSEPSIPVTSAPTDVSVCERTQLVVTAIMGAISDDIDCADVTAVHLARIGELDISSSEVTVLQNGDFDGLTSLFRLDLSGILLSTLPATIFNGLTNLRSLSLADNDLISLPPNVFAGLSNLDALDLSGNSNDGGEYTFTLTLVRTDETNLARGPATVSLQIAEGAPFTMTVPIITSNTESVSDVSLTIAAGNAESDVLTVTHQMDSTEHASLRLGTLPSIPSGFDGIQLVAGTALQLFPAVPGIPTDVVTTVFGVSQIRVSWTAPDNDGGSPITGYRADVVIAGQAQTYSCIANGAHRTACTTMTLPSDSPPEYSVRVVAINAVGESNPSIPAIGTFTNFGFRAGFCEPHAAGNVRY